MGVSFFMSWLAERYPLIFKRMDDPSKPRFDCFYIDFNSIIHFATEFIDPEKPGGYDELISEVIRYLVTIVQIVQPSKLIYISVDGTPPYAKCVNNRNARLKWTMNEQYNKGKTKFDVVAGTEFMEKLHMQLEATIKELTKSNRIWAKPQVVYSSYHVPGEAEHKISEFIHGLIKEPSYDPNTVHCTFSMDSDTFFLALGTHLPYFCIMRECIATHCVSKDVEFLKNEKSTSSAFELLYVNLAREYMTLDFCNGIYNKYLFDDFISLVFFMGNDFIPEFNELPSQKSTFDRICDCYKDTIVSNGLHIVEDGHFVKESIIMLLDSLITDAIISGTIKETTDADIFSLFRKEINSGNKALREEISVKAVENLDWTLQYYMGECPSWDYFYPFEFSPPVSLLRDAFESYEQHKFERGSPVEPFECLLITCPFEGKTDLPQPFLELTKKGSEISHLFPHTDVFKDFTAEKRNIAFPQREMFSSAYKKAKEMVSNEDMKKNMLCEDVLIENGEEKAFSSIVLSKNDGILEPFYPSLTKNPIWSSFSLESANIFIFSEPSKLKTLILNTEQKEEIGAEDFKAYVGKEVLYDWPFIKPGIVHSVSDRNVTIECIDNEIKRRPTQKDFPNNQIKEDYLHTHGFNFSDVNVLFTVFPTKLSSITDDMFTVSNEAVCFPHQLIQTEVKDEIKQRFTNKVIGHPIVGERIVFKDGPSKGEIGQLVSVNVKEGTCKAVILASRDPVIHADEAKPQKESGKSEGQSWISANDIIADYNIKLKVLKKALVQLPKKAVKNKGNNIEISVKSLPQLLDILGVKHKQVQKKKSGKAKKGESKTKKPKITNLAEFMKDVERKLISLDIRTFEGNEVTESLDNVVWRGKRLDKIAAFNSIGTRVISIADTELIPFGIKGTIVEFHESEYEALVISDVELPFGTTLGNRLKTKRGFTAKYGDLVPFE